MNCRRLFVSLMGLSTCLRGLCCIPNVYYPEDYYIYRVCPDPLNAAKESQRERNLRSWKETGGGTLKDIEEVVYSWNAEEVKHMYYQMIRGNTFACQLFEDRSYDVIDYLVTAKQCEKACAARASRWYYPFKDDPEVSMLESVSRTSDHTVRGIPGERGYIDRDYLCEVVGTSYMYRNPFVYEDTGRQYFDNYKLAFAKEMRDLRQKTRSTDPDVRGEALVRMGTGMRSSFTNCWALTQYHDYCYDRWPEDKRTQDAIRKADTMIDEGLSTIRDHEKAAAAYLSQYLFLSVAEKFPRTATGQMVKGQCDKLYDHIRRQK